MRLLIDMDNKSEIGMIDWEFIHDMQGIAPELITPEIIYLTQDFLDKIPGKWSKIRSKLEERTPNRNTIYNGNGNRNGFSDEYKKKYERLVNALCQAQRLLKPRTVERRVLRAVLHKGCVQRDMEGLLQKFDFSFGRGRIRSQASTDYNVLASGNTICINPEITFCTIDDNVIQKCLNFLLSDNYIVPSVYGTREIVLYPDEVITLPCLTRKMSIHLMVHDYLQSINADEKIATFAGPPENFPAINIERSINNFPKPTLVAKTPKSMNKKT